MNQSDILFWCDSIVIAAFACMVLQWADGNNPLWLLL